MISSAEISILIAGIATLAIFSFIIKENWFYRIFEHLFVGLAAGWGIVVTVKNFLWPIILSPMLGFDLVVYPDGTLAEARNYYYLLYLLPLAFGLLYYTAYSKKYSWLSKLVIGVSLGASAGLAFQGFFNQMLPQLESSFKPLIVFPEGALKTFTSIDWFESFSNFLFVFTLLSVMYYFFFTIRSSQGMTKFSAAGRYLMMICFGAYFGSTVMARMALLVERLQFLLGPWFNTLKSIGGI